MRIFSHTLAACALTAALTGCGDATPPELTDRDPDRGTELAFRITGYERRANGTQLFAATALLNGSPVGFDLELAPWKENPPGILDMPTWECSVRWHSRGPQSDALLAFMDGLYATGLEHKRMVHSIDLTAFSPWKNPGDFEEPVTLRLLFPPNDFEDRSAELKLDVDFYDSRIYLREVDTSLRRSVIWRLSAPPASG